MSDHKKIYALIALVMIVLILYVYRREHTSNVDMVGEALVLAQRVGDPTESAILMDIAKQNEHFRGDESDAPYRYNMHLISKTPDFMPYEKIELEHFRNETPELIDLLTA